MWTSEPPDWTDVSPKPPEKARRRGGLRRRKLQRNLQLASGPRLSHVDVMTVSDQAQHLRDDFAFLDDWEARFAHLIDMGRALPPLSATELVDLNKVRGCSSQVWLVAAPSSQTAGALTFRGASDALIVSGLVAMVLKLFSEQTPADILAFDAKALMHEIGVAEALTPQRSNGLKSMLARIRAEAQAAV
jgi:cysteine desulfuration protein SufE